MRSSIEESRPFLREMAIDEPKQRVNRARDSFGGSDSRSDFWSTCSMSILSHTAVFVVTCLVWGAIFASILHYPDPIDRGQSNSPRRNSSHPDTRMYLTCGQSLEEAKILGCKYDILTNTWLPDQCTDQLSIEEYQADNSWFPYADENRTQALSVDQLGNLQFYYTSMRDHIVHCAVLWKRQFRAFTEQRPYVDSITIDLEHTLHCADFLMEKSDLEEYRNMPIKVFVGHTGCHVRDINMANGVQNQ